LEQKYLTIRQFAEAVGKSQQAIHQQLETRLKSYVKVIDKRKYIDNTAIREVFGIDDFKEKSSDLSSDLTSIQATLQVKNEMIENLKQQISGLIFDKEKLNEQLTVKDDQIKKLQKLLDQEQQLHKQTKDQYQLLLVDKEEPPEHLQEQLTTKDNMLTEQAEQIEKLKAELTEEKSKGFFKRLFKK